MLKMKRLLVSVFVLLSASMLWGGSCFADFVTVSDETSLPSSNGFSLNSARFNYSIYPTSFVPTSDSTIISSFSSTDRFTYSESGSFSFPALEDSGSLIVPWNGGYERDISSSGSASGSSSGSSSSTITQSGIYFFPCSLTISITNNSDKFRYLSNSIFTFTSPTHLIFEDSSLIANFYGNNYTIVLPLSYFAPHSTTLFSIDFLAHSTTPQRPAFPSSFRISGGSSSIVSTPTEQDVAGLIIDQTDQQRDQYNEATSAGNSSAYDSVVSDSSSVRGFGDSIEAVATPVLQLFDGSRTFGEPDLVFPGLLVNYTPNAGASGSSGHIISFKAGTDLSFTPDGTSFRSVWQPYTFNLRTFFEQYHLSFLKTAVNFATVFLVYSGLLKYLLDVWDKLMNGAYAGDQF